MRPSIQVTLAFRDRHVGSIQFGILRQYQHIRLSIAISDEVYVDTNGVVERVGLWQCNLMRLLRQVLRPST